MIELAMRLKDTIAFVVAAAVVFGAYASIVGFMLHLESAPLF
jgi:hypothetical protein